MQHIGMILEDEKGVVIEKSKLNFAEVLSVLKKDDYGSYPWLSSVDPYGLTYFNLYQVPKVVAELKTLESMIPLINEYLGFLSKVGQHKYIKLIGD